MMYQAYMIFRSVTAGQRAKALLDASGLPCQLRRSPRQLSPAGCAYAMTVREADLDRALRFVRGGNMKAEAIYLRRPDGSFERVEA